MANRFTIKVGIEPDLHVHDFKKSITDRLTESPVKIPLDLNVLETNRRLIQNLRKLLTQKNGNLPALEVKIKYDKSSLTTALDGIKSKLAEVQKMADISLGVNGSNKTQSASKSAATKISKPAASAASATRISTQPSVKTEIEKHDEPISVRVIPDLSGFVKEIGDLRSTIPPIEIPVSLASEKLLEELALIKTKLSETGTPIVIPVQLDQTKYQEDLSAAQQATSQTTDSMKLPSKSKFKELSDAAEKATSSILSAGASMEASSKEASGFNSKLETISLTFAYAAEEAEKYAAALKSIKGIGDVNMTGQSPNGRTRILGGKTIDAMHRTKLAGAGKISNEHRTADLDANIAAANEKRKQYLALIASDEKNIDAISAALIEYKDTLAKAEKSLKASQAIAEKAEKQKSSVKAAENKRNFEYVTQRLKRSSIDQSRSEKILFAGDGQYIALAEAADKAAQSVKNVDKGMDVDPKKVDEIHAAAQAYKELDAYVNKTRSKNYIDTGNQNERTKLNNLAMRVEKYLELNDKIARDPQLYKEFTDLEDQAKKAAITNPDASRRFGELKLAAEEAGLATQSLGDRLKKLFNDHFKTAVVMAGLHLMETGFRNLFQNVVDVDTAMTELRKVSNGTAADYNSFLNNAASRAKNLGTTISDVVNASAEFSRLGYNLDQSAQLADAAVMYKNVSEYENVNDAAQSIVSTMQAFGIEAENVTSIVDRLNNVGKKVA